MVEHNYVASAAGEKADRAIEHRMQPALHVVQGA